MIKYHQMCRLTCSRCWQELIQLGQQADNKSLAEVFILAPGESRYLSSAQQLASDLTLPVQFVITAQTVQGNKHTFSHS